MPARKPEKSATQAARSLLRDGFTPQDIAKKLSLHDAYVRKIIQRDSGRDQSWKRWRERNPEKVRAYRARDNSARQGRR